MALSEEFLLELKSRNNIEDVISSYVNLKKAGRNMKGLCPFHNEKTPSFTIYPENGSFYCFGCGTGGDVISFIRKIENLDYIDAVKFLAERSGMSMPVDGADDSFARIRSRVLSVNRESAKFFNSVLMSPKGSAGYSYFTSRGIDDAAIRHFGLGFSPDSWTSLVDHLKSCGFTTEEMQLANVASKSQKSGNYFDRYRNRIMFPLIDVRGNVIAFGGRKLPDADGAKYVNSSETPVYKKGENVYGLNFAKNYCSEQLIICEGYMDCIALHRAGFRNTVAALGTAFTPEQARLLKRYTKELILCFDSDDAGQKATDRAIQTLGAAGLKLKIVRVPDGKDPDEFMRVNSSDGYAKFKKLIDSAMSTVEYSLGKAAAGFSLDTEDGKLQFLEKASIILAAVESPIEREIYAARLADTYGVSKDAILKQAFNSSKKIERKRVKDETHRVVRPVVRDNVNPDKPLNRRAANAEEGLLAVMLRRPELIESVSKEISADDFITSFNKRIFNMLVDRKKQGKSIDITLLGNELSSDEIGRIAEITSKGAERAVTADECRMCISIMKEEKTKISSKIVSSGDDNDFVMKIRELANNKVKGENVDGN